MAIVRLLPDTAIIDPASRIEYEGRNLLAEPLDAVRAGVAGFLETRERLFATRFAERRVADGHGDIRLDAVCFTDGVCIFDCIEFNQRFRYSDVAADLAFLAMDLDYEGRPDLARSFATQMAAALNDDDMPRLMDFYKCYRAFVRGKVLGMRLADRNLTPTLRAEVEHRARKFFMLAQYRLAERLYVLAPAGLLGAGPQSTAWLYMFWHGGFPVAVAAGTVKAIDMLVTAEGTSTPN